MPNMSSISNSSISEAFLLPLISSPVDVTDLPVVALVTAGEGLFVVTIDELVVECL